MTEIDALSARIRTCADKHGAWEIVADKVKKIRDKRINEDLYFEMCRQQAIANSQGLKSVYGHLSTMRVGCGFPF